MSQSDPHPTSVFQSGSVDFPVEELSQHRGRWVAFSPDGTRLIGSDPTLAALEAQVRAAGEDVEEVLFEKVPDGVSIASGSVLS
jgi:hypothetical protein